MSEESGLERVPSLIMRPFCKRAEQAIFLEERVDCTAVRSLLSMKLKKRALNEPSLVAPACVGGSDVMLAARTTQEREGRSISFFSGAFGLFIEACEEMARVEVDGRWVVVVHICHCSFPGRCL